MLSEEYPSLSDLRIVSYLVWIDLKNLLICMWFEFYITHMVDRMDLIGFTWLASLYGWPEAENFDLWWICSAIIHHFKTPYSLCWLQISLFVCMCYTVSSCCHELDGFFLDFLFLDFILFLYSCLVHDSERPSLSLTEFTEPKLRLWSPDTFDIFYMKFTVV